MTILWMVHRTVVVALVFIGLSELADTHETLTVALVIFLIFATGPAGISAPSWTRMRQRD